MGNGGFAGGVPSVCGDGIVGSGESCDDGNTSDGDGCGATCELEPGYTCPWNEPCRPVICGDGNEDGYVDADGVYVYEQCDDGNTSEGDGCSSTCLPEVGYYCSYPGEPCKKVVCGDGSQDLYVSGFGPGLGAAGTGAGGAGFGGSGMGSGFAGSGTSGPFITYGYEQCDDGNAVSGDGCSAACQIESPYICVTPGSPCRVPRCGDGFVDYIQGAGGGGAGGMMGGAGSGAYGFVEGCDDGNVTSGDGCSATCTIEAGYSCPNPAAPCKLAVCGDGIVDWPAESCDDGNRTPGDGCNDHCQAEYGTGGYGGAFGGSAGSSFVGSAGSGPVTRGGAGSSFAAGGAR